MTGQEITLAELGERFAPLIIGIAIFVWGLIKGRKLYKELKIEGRNKE